VQLLRLEAQGEEREKCVLVSTGGVTEGGGATSRDVPELFERSLMACFRWKPERQPNPPVIRRGATETIPKERRLKGEAGEGGC